MSYSPFEDPPEYHDSIAGNNAMNENEEIRIACAEAMGWTIGTPITGQGAIHWRSEKKWMAGYDDQRPNYPADANAALQLAHALAEKGWDLVLSSRLGTGKWAFTFAKEPNLTFTATATGPHAFALALCKAFLEVDRAGKEQQ